jgi:hypothetical protein
MQRNAAKKIQTEANLPERIRQVAGLYETGTRVVSWTKFDYSHCCPRSGVYGTCKECLLSRYECCRDSSVYGVCKDVVGFIACLPVQLFFELTFFPQLLHGLTESWSSLVTAYWVLCEHDLKIVTKNFFWSNRVVAIPLLNVVGCVTEEAGAYPSHRTEIRLSYGAQVPNADTSLFVGKGLASYKTFAQEILNQRAVLRRNLPSQLDSQLDVQVGVEAEAIVPIPTLQAAVIPILAAQPIEFMETNAPEFQMATMSSNTSQPIVVGLPMGPPPLRVDALAGCGMVSTTASSREPTWVPAGVGTEEDLSGNSQDILNPRAVLRQNPPSQLDVQVGLEAEAIAPIQTLQAVVMPILAAQAIEFMETNAPEFQTATVSTSTSQPIVDIDVGLPMGPPPLRVDALAGRGMVSATAFLREPAWVPADVGTDEDLPGESQDVLNQQAVIQQNLQSQLDSGMDVEAGLAMPILAAQPIAFTETSRPVVQTMTMTTWTAQPIDVDVGLPRTNLPLRVDTITDGEMPSTTAFTPGPMQVPAGVGTDKNLPGHIRKAAHLEGTKTLFWTTFDPVQICRVWRYHAWSFPGSAWLLPCFWPPFIAFLPFLVPQWWAGVRHEKHTFWILCERELTIVYGRTQFSISIPLENISCCIVDGVSVSVWSVKRDSNSSNNKFAGKAKSVGLKNFKWFVQAIIDQQLKSQSQCCHQGDVLQAGVERCLEFFSVNRVAHEAMNVQSMTERGLPSQ